MEKLINKISNYHVFNYLVPGGVYIIIFDSFVEKVFYTSNYIILFLIAYFIGVIISRFGSLVISKILYKFTKQVGDDYSNYIDACNKDQKVDELMQDKNMYRSFCSMLVLLLISKIVKIIIDKFNINIEILIIIIAILLIVLFSLSFLKQNRIINERVKANKNKTDTQ